MKKGILYGIGVGPGDPELMTLKAVSAIRGCDIIAIPHKNREQCLALKIATGAVPELTQMPIQEIHMPMTKDPEVLNQAYQAGADILCALLQEGKQVGFLTLGDPSVYSTYMYLHYLVRERGYDARIIPGIPSFCAAAAVCGEALCLGDEELHVIPGNYGNSDALNYPGTKIIMKNDAPELRALLKNSSIRVTTVEKCGLPDQKIYHGIHQVPEEKSYFRLMILRDSDKP